jgi:hypothetical protein
MYLYVLYRHSNGGFVVIIRLMKGNYFNACFKKSLAWRTLTDKSSQSSPEYSLLSILWFIVSGWERKTAWVCGETW